MIGTNASADPGTRPRTSTLDRPTLMRLAATEYDRLGAVLAGLDAQDWTRRTECAGWDVRAMAGHVLGMADMAASIRERRRQQKPRSNAVAFSSTRSPHCKLSNAPNSPRSR